MSDHPLEKISSICDELTEAMALLEARIEECQGRGGEHVELEVALLKVALLQHQRRLASLQMLQNKAVLLE